MTLKCQKSPFLGTKLLAKIYSDPPRPCLVCIWTVSTNRLPTSGVIIQTHSVAYCFSSKKHLNVESAKWAIAWLN